MLKWILEPEARIDKINIHCPCFRHIIHIYMVKQRELQTDTQIDNKLDKKRIDRQLDRQVNTQKDGQTDK